MSIRIYDVYLNRRNDLLVVPRGYPVPSELGESWSKRKRVRAVSEVIREQVEQRGYYRRRSCELMNKHRPG
ncbi:hypothetical protein ACQR1W_26945 [Bradyrhizobium sp. HKCCYLS1011]|uniref:hypothetical protein n=1 Tax=Bradyrhizobium sp. HKCCYLS1011 TaxID=3420733 RepID=UPI003EBD89FF